MDDLWLYMTMFLVFYFIFKTFLHKYQNLPPCPFPTIPILGHLHLFKAPIHRNLAQLAASHGPILHLQLGSRRAVLISSPAAAEECLNKNDVIFANRPPLLAGKIFGYNFTTILWAPYGELWRNLRRIASTEILSTHRLQLLAGIRADEVRSLLLRIYNRSKTGEGVENCKLNMQSHFHEIVNNVMLMMIAGKRYYWENEETDEAKKFRDIVIAMKKLGDIFSVEDLFPALRWFGSGKRKVYRALFAEIDEFFENLVGQHRRRRMEEGLTDSVKDNDDSFVSVLLSLQKKDPQFYTEEIIKGLVFLLLLAGTDTSAGTMEWALSLLLNNSTILKKAQSEIDQVVGHQRLINESDISHLPYLHCIILETLRMYPVAPLLPHYSSDYCTVGDYRIPHNTMLMINVWAIQNDPNLWDEPRKFKPERFEGGQRLGYKLLPFGSGRRACPGEGLAMKMVGLVLGSILQCFYWERVGDELVDMEENVGLTLPRANPLFAKCRPRQHIIKLLLA